MNTLKTAFLLAATATATQLDATDYLATWTLTNGNIVSTTIGVNPALFNASGTNSWSSGSPTAWLTKLDLVIKNPGNAVLGSWTKADVNNFYWDASSVNFSVPHTNLNFYNIYIFANQYNMDPMMMGFSSAYGVKYVWPFIFDSFGPAFSGVANIASWMSSIDGAHRTYNSGVALGELPMEGAHHRPMMSFDRMGKDSQAWATGDFGTSSRLRDSHISTGEVGVNWNVGKTGLFGFAAGHGEQNEDLALGGSSNVRGEYALAEYDFRPEGTQWIFSAVAMVGDWNARLARCYDNSGSTDTSLGQTGLNTRSLRLRVDAPSVASLGGFSFAPYASYTVTHTSVDAFTETGGGFPASFNEQKHNAIEARLGVNASKDLSEQTKLILSFEGIHRFDGAGPSLSGQDITGSVAFSLPGTAPRPDCVRLGFDVDHKLNANTLLNFSAHASSVGEVSDFSCALSIRRAF